MQKRPAVFKKIQKDYEKRSKTRRLLIGKANDALNHSKRAIFALHRDDAAKATDHLKTAKGLFKDCEKFFSANPDLQYEGAYRAALEEYAEAILFELYVEEKDIGEIEKRAMRGDVYLAGLSDATGEIVRHAMRAVTDGKTQELARAREVVEMVIQFMLDLDLTGYLRTKFDQAKKNLRKLEEMSYDISIRE